MAMADFHSLKIMNQIQALISDQLQVVSYKWLSRKFSVPSNAAKRLLQDFVELHGDGLEVIYALSGWSKSEPRCYSVQLVPKAKLEEVKAELADDSSTHIYSVQSCLPKDPAELWSAEFVQSEELFNQPSSIDNCLRDNRFSAVSYSFVKRNFTGKNVRVAPPVPEEHLVSLSAATAKESSKDDVLPEQIHVSSPLQKSVAASSKASGQASTAATDPKTVSDVKDASGGKSMNASDTNKVSAAATNKRKGHNGKSTEGALASLWGRATSKPKPSSVLTDNVENVLPPALNAEAQICAWEATGNISSDDEVGDFSRIRRSLSNNGSGRKRQVVLNMSDDESEDGNLDSKTVISLASPDLPKQRSDFKAEFDTDIMQNKGTVQGNENLKECQGVDKTNASSASKSKNKSVSGILSGQSHGKSKGKANDSADDKNPSSSSKENLSSVKVPNNENATVQMEHVPSDNLSMSKTAIKKRKVLKTHIDDRGREVTEVAWEVDGVESEKIKDLTNPVKKSSAPGQSDNKPQTTAKGPSMEHNHTNNPNSRTSSKHTTKGAGKDTRQGNILSFFKKT